MTLREAYEKTHDKFIVMVYLSEEKEIYKYSDLVDDYDKYIVTDTNMFDDVIVFTINTSKESVEKGEYHMKVSEYNVNQIIDDMNVNVTYQDVDTDKKYHAMIEIRDWEIVNIKKYIADDGFAILVLVKNPNSDLRMMQKELDSLLNSFMGKYCNKHESCSQCSSYTEKDINCHCVIDEESILTTKCKYLYFKLVMKRNIETLVKELENI